jgi:predicted nucleotidyltransferase
MSRTPEENFTLTVRSALSDIAEVYTFGSQVTGTAVWDTDVDLAVLFRWGNEFWVYDKKGYPPIHLVNKRMQEVAERLPKSVKIENMIPHARSPLIKVRFGKVWGDIVINDGNGVLNSRLLRDFLGMADERVVHIVQWMKIWAKSHGLIGGSCGNLTSYALTIFTLCVLRDVNWVGSVYAYPVQREAINGLVFTGAEPWEIDEPEDDPDCTSVKNMVRFVLTRLRDALDPPASMKHRFAFTIFSEDCWPKSSLLLPPKDTRPLVIYDPLLGNNVAATLKQGKKQNLLSAIRRALNSINSGAGLNEII